MKYIVFLLFATQLVLGQEAWEDRSRIYPQKLRNLPTGLFLFHTPSPNYPEPRNDPKLPKYKWEHDTCVMPLSEGLEIMEAGSFIWTAQQGWIPNMSFSKKEAQKAFSLPKSGMEKGDTYCFEKNTRYGNQLFGGDALWYVIAQDAQGNRYKGVGIIETEDKIITKN